MKHCRKMKLVNCDDYVPNISTERIQKIICTTEDDFYKKNHILPILDKEMEKIIHQTNIPDYDKWLMYNEVLQRYLFFVKQQLTQSFNNDQPMYENNQSAVKTYSNPNNLSMTETPKIFKFGESFNNNKTPDVSQNVIKSLRDSLRRESSTRKRKILPKRKRVVSPRTSPIITRRTAKEKSNLNEIFKNWEKLGKDYMKSVENEQ